MYYWGTNEWNKLLLSKSAESKEEDTCEQKIPVQDGKPIVEVARDI